MLDPVLDEIQWSSTVFSLKNVLELLDLPQVVKVKSVSPRFQRLKGLHDNDVIVLNSSRSIETIRATDSLKNEYYIPLDSAAKVEVIWKNYKMFYDNVEELHEHFPNHVIVEECEENLGIKKGDVLKLKQRVSSRNSSYLQCDIKEKPDAEVNVSFNHRGIFKTLGDLTSRDVFLIDVINCCKLPIDVKFLDNKLKVKKIDGSSRYPMGLFNIEGYVTLHNIVNYGDVIAQIILPNESVDMIAIPLSYEDFQLYVPTAATRNKSKYTQFCSTKAQEIGPEILQEIGIEHKQWIVYRDNDCASYLPKQQNNPKPVPRKRASICKIAISQSTKQHEHTVSSSSQTTKQPTEEDYNFEPTVVTRKNSNSFPRILTPSQKNDTNGSNPEIYQTILLGRKFQDEPEREGTGFLRVNHLSNSPNFDEEDGYVTMKANVALESMLREERKIHKSLSVNQSDAKIGQSHAYQSQIARLSVKSLEKLKNRPKFPLPEEFQATQTTNRSVVKTKRSNDHSVYEVVPALKFQADRRNVQGDKVRIMAPQEREYSDRNVNAWSVDDVSRVLQNIGLDKYVEVFSAMKVDGKVLAGLNEENLVRSLKMSDKSDLQRLLCFTENCVKNERSTTQNEYHTL